MMPLLDKVFHRYKRRPDARRMDETFIKEKGQWEYL